MEFDVLGWPDDDPTVRLDWTRFAYAGKFVMSNTGKALARDDGDIVGAVSFNADRTDDAVGWLRYVTVREDYRGEGVGPRLCAHATDRLHERYDTVKIAVNNPFAYHALHKAGFGWTGDTTGLAELVLAHPAPADADYETGLGRYRERDLSEAEAAFVAEKLDAGAPAAREPPA
ncbi:GNAT family N-acetyltransferase [Salarchaeum sp. JOR-1]|uniref:GNAT family N-acetyltransferase n=1 Tax=Salarchaeum sp. JOR-1 TaxID=2599399 RepID=UPI001198C0DE|nr:GNAT family N-acetyltransferase [Salarchaeum sp. JOR-1]QDX41094.1 GNAT family N-acetyltransferase [Salarchaeum sp. JOR-1]